MQLISASKLNYIQNPTKFSIYLYYYQFPKITLNSLPSLELKMLKVTAEI